MKHFPTVFDVIHLLVRTHVLVEQIARNGVVLLMVSCSGRSVDLDMDNNTIACQYTFSFWNCLINLDAFVCKFSILVLVFRVTKYLTLFSESLNLTMFRVKKRLGSWDVQNVYPPAKWNKCFIGSVSKNLQNVWWIITVLNFRVGIWCWYDSCVNKLQKNWNCSDLRKMFQTDFSVLNVLWLCFTAIKFSPANNIWPLAWWATCTKMWNTDRPRKPTRAQNQMQRQDIYWQAQELAQAGHGRRANGRNIFRLHSSCCQWELFRHPWSKPTQPKCKQIMKQETN